jgi:hypothetical protein
MIIGAGLPLAGVFMLVYFLRLALEWDFDGHVVLISLAVVIGCWFVASVIAYESSIHRIKAFANVLTLKGVAPGVVDAVARWQQFLVESSPGATADPPSAGDAPFRDLGASQAGPNSVTCFRCEAVIPREKAQFKVRERHYLCPACTAKDRRASLTKVGAVVLGTIAVIAFIVLRIIVREIMK